MLKFTVSGKDFLTLSTLSAEMNYSECYCYGVLYKKKFIRMSCCLTNTVKFKNNRNLLQLCQTQSCNDISSRGVNGAVL